jgi:hypothetical protein
MPIPAPDIEVHSPSDRGLAHRCARSSLLVIALKIMTDNLDLRQPLNTFHSIQSRHDRPYRKAMRLRQRHSVHVVRKQHIPGHRTVNRNAIGISVGCAKDHIVGRCDTLASFGKARKESPCHSAVLMDSPPTVLPTHSSVTIAEVEGFCIKLRMRNR